MSRQYEHAYREWRTGPPHFASLDGVARHIFPAFAMNMYDGRGNDHMGNYRMGSSRPNGFDSSIDNMVLRQGYFDPCARQDGRYISYDRAWSRMNQQLDSMNQMDNPSRRHLRKMYLTAQDIPGVDLRAFNGWQFDRR